MAIAAAVERTATQRYQRCHVSLHTTVVLTGEQPESGSTDAIAARVGEICQAVIEQLSSVKPEDITALGRNIVKTRGLIIKFDISASPVLSGETAAATRKYYISVNTRSTLAEKQPADISINTTEEEAKKIGQTVIEQLSSAKPEDMIELPGGKHIMVGNFLMLKLQPPASLVTLGISAAAGDDICLYALKKATGGEDLVAIKGNRETALPIIEAMLHEPPKPDAETEQQKQNRLYQLVELADGALLIVRRGAAFTHHDPRNPTARPPKKEETAQPPKKEES